MSFGIDLQRSGAIGGLAVLLALIGIAVTVFWMVVGWRAMKAHEKLADAAEEISRRHN